MVRWDRVQDEMIATGCDELTAYRTVKSRDAVNAAFRRDRRHNDYRFAKN